MRKVYLALFALLVARVLVASLGHSGESVPPKFGDYEAQRHWMEITTSLPVAEWYFNTTDNDLQYWGLDYPPLTAMHSWLCGKAAQIFEPESVALHSSRGYETTSHKIFMRSTVIVADILLLFPSIWLVVTAIYKNRAERISAFLVTAAQPGLLLIDHGHFQYNNISIGLSLLAAGLIMHQWDVLGAFVFTLALNYKQMTLYYAPAFFLVLLARSVHRGGGITFKSFLNVLFIGFAVIAAFLVCWAPFLLQPDPLSQVLQILHRVFPVGRGLYEDKVANLWCSISPVFKLQNYANSTQMVRICTALTLAGLIPLFIVAWKYKRRFWSILPRMSALETRLGGLEENGNAIFAIMLSLSAWSFFFFSFHVHEKTVLLPILPMTIWVHYAPNEVSVANLVSTISMLPLLTRDGHEYSLLVSIAVYSLVLSVLRRNVSGILVVLASSLSLAPYIVSHMAKPPARYPDLFVLVLTAISFVIMLACVASVYAKVFSPNGLRRFKAAAKNSHKD